ncbi:endoplasmic reticulum-based factor for assembly of V-ATPase-domain-containing protein [Hyaloscypha finlandica]|nr:endoplasmic reticulum-based factor for assembly of V-ATPase-domain-containing protein [Hyaloscypha finlandica]
MVLLTMTASIVQALEKLERPKRNAEGERDAREKNSKVQGIDGEAQEKNEKSTDSDQDPSVTAQKQSSEPSLYNPKVGNPISHSQVVDIARDMKARRIQPSGLEALLKGSRVYVPAPLPKLEPTSAYKALMVRLRREEEERSYERMTNPPPPMETFAQRFPASSAAHAFSSSYQNINTSDPDDDGLTFADVDRQMALILNVLLSIVACAGAIWVAARWWNTPARLALSMSGSILVGVAEVVVYSGYIRRVGEAKGKEKVVKEVKEIVNTWVVGAGDEASGVDDTESSTSIEPIHSVDDVKARRRKRDTS